MAGPSLKRTVEVDAPVPCARCGGVLVIAVASGEYGTIVSARCNACMRMQIPYEGPGAKQALLAAGRPKT
jgi:hypothetical protein